MMEKTYDRPLIRTTHSLTLWLIVNFLLMLALITIVTFSNPALQASDMIPLYAHAVIVIGVTRRVLTRLREFEKEQPIPTKAMELLFSIALLLPPVAGLMPLGLLLRYLRLVS